MPLTINIPGREGGTWAVLEVIRALGLQGLTSGWTLPYPADVEPFLRAQWNYVFQPLVDTQELKAPDLLASEYLTTNRFTGACADAAALAIALLPAGSVGAVCAMRSPRSPGFEHVLVKAGPFLIDPTAPATADYTHWESLCLPFTKGVPRNGG